MTNQPTMSQHGTSQFSVRHINTKYVFSRRRCTVFRSISHLLRHFPSSALAWRHTSSNSVTRNYCCRTREVTLSFTDMSISLTYLWLAATNRKYLEQRYKTQLTKTPPSLSSIQCFGALIRFKCFFGPRPYKSDHYLSYYVECEI